MNKLKFLGHFDLKIEAPKKCLLQPDFFTVDQSLSLLYFFHFKTSIFCRFVLYFRKV
jgi:hypothetical protein